MATLNKTDLEVASMEYLRRIPLLSVWSWSLKTSKRLVSVRETSILPWSAALPPESPEHITLCGQLLMSESSRAHVLESITRSIVPVHMVRVRVRWDE